METPHEQDTHDHPTPPTAPFGPSTENLKSAEQAWTSWRRCADEVSLYAVHANQGTPRERRSALEHHEYCLKWPQTKQQALEAALTRCATDASQPPHHIPPTVRLERLRNFLDVRVSDLPDPEDTRLVKEVDIDIKSSGPTDACAGWFDLAWTLHLARTLDEAEQTLNGEALAHARRAYDTGRTAGLDLPPPSFHAEPTSTRANVEQLTIHAAQYAPENTTMGMLAFIRAFARTTDLLKKIVHERQALDCHGRFADRPEKETDDVRARLLDYALTKAEEAHTRAEDKEMRDAATATLTRVTPTNPRTGGTTPTAETP